MTKNVLIIIRGNSGSGKSTVARELRLRMVERGMKTALVEQDYLRRTVLKENEIENGDNIKLIEQTVTFSLDNDYSVVLEGILAHSRYGEMLKRLIEKSHRSLLYYMDVPFEETLRRHSSKNNAHEFGEKEMRSWWLEQDLMNLPNEKIISRERTVEQTVETILRDIR